ncbi:MAG: helix-turn-helix domain-containing protein [Caldibacillus sp.]
MLLKAVELFAQKGYMNTLTSEIVQRARVAEGTIFRHYKTKEKLLLAILVPIVQNALPRMTEEMFREIFATKPASIEEFIHVLTKDDACF